MKEEMYVMKNSRRQQGKPILHGCNVVIYVER